MEMHVLSTIAKCAMTIATFDFWMSKIGFATFAFVINFIDGDWVFCHVTIGRFEVLNTFGATLIEQLKLFWATYQFIN